MRLEPALCQCRTALALMLQTLVQGMSEGWSSPALINLEDGDGPFALTTEEESLIVTRFWVGLFVGAFASSVVFSHAGRRWTLAVAPLSYVVWIALTVAARSAGYLYAACLFAGVGKAVNFTLSSIYIGEVTTPAMRGALILVMTLLAPLGQLLAFAVEPYVSYWWGAVLPAFPLALCLICTVLFTLETPFYLSMRDRHEDALRQLTRLRRGLPEEEVRGEAAEIQRCVLQQRQEEHSWREGGFRSSARFWVRARYASGIVLVISGSYALLGVDVVLSYSQEIFKESGTVLSKSVSSMLVIGVKVVMIVAAMYLIERLGRRLLLSVTAFINGLAMTAMALYFLGKEHLGWDTEATRWVPLAALMIFMAATGGGVIPVSYVLIGELLSQELKKNVAPLASAILAVTSLVISRYYLPLGDSVGFCVPFAFFALTNFFISFFALKFVLETKGKTLVQVQDEMSGRTVKKIVEFRRKMQAQSADPATEHILDGFVSESDALVSV